MGIVFFPFLFFLIFPFYFRLQKIQEWFKIEYYILFKDFIISIDSNQFSQYCELLKIWKRSINKGSNQTRNQTDRAGIRPSAFFFFFSHFASFFLLITSLLLPLPLLLLLHPSFKSHISFSFLFSSFFLSSLPSSEFSFSFSFPFDFPSSFLPSITIEV